MWARAAGLSSAELGKFDLAQDLVAIRAAPTSYGTVILGKLRLPAVHDEQGEGFVHVRYVFFPFLLSSSPAKGGGTDPAFWCVGSMIRRIGGLRMSCSIRSSRTKVTAMQMDARRRGRRSKRRTCPLNSSMNEIVRVYGSVLCSEKLNRSVTVWLMCVGMVAAMKVRPPHGTENM